MKKILVADIGGTNARFALVSDCGEHFTAMQQLSCDQFESFDDAVNQYLDAKSISELDAICIAAAGPVVEQSVQFTNNHWRISHSGLASLCKTGHARLLNDFEAIACSLPALTDADTQSIGGDWPLPKGNELNLGVLGAGTGLGVSGLYVRDGKNHPVITEGGHTGFSPETNEQIELLKNLKAKFGRVSNERLLSGPGIVNIYEALTGQSDYPSDQLTAAEIATRGTEKQDALCEKTMDLFFEILGQVAGDLALSSGALNGIFIAGGIGQKNGLALQNSQFRQGFINKGRYQKYMEAIPTWLVTHKNPGLIGASNYAQQHLIT